MMRNTKLASVQQQYVRAREIIDGTLCLWSPTSPTKRSYRAILEVAPINFLLKSAEEQDGITERYRLLLKALPFPLQILVRHQRLDLEPYLARIRERVQANMQSRWPQLADNLEHLLRQLGSRRTLIERRCYLIVPAPEAFGPSLGKKKRTRQSVMDRALQELDIRVETLRQQLLSLGLHTHRLRGEEIARLLQSCLAAEQAWKHPLKQEHLAVVGHLPRWEKAAQAQTQDGRQEARSTSHEGPAGPQKQRARPRKSSAALPPPDFLRLADLLAPASIEEFQRALRVGEHDWVRGIAVTAFPREVAPGWLAPLLMHDDILDIVMHLHPQEQAATMRQLKRRRAGYASIQAFQRRQGRQDDPDTGVAQNDVDRTIGRLARGEERLFEVTFSLLVRAPSQQALDERSERVLARLQTVLLDAVAHPTTFEHAAAFRSSLPEGRDELRRTITLDTASMATAFLFLSNALAMPNGAFLGTTSTNEPVLLDPWHPSLENPHAFVGGVTGGGKSYLGKLWIERALLLQGIGPTAERHSVIDPDGEFSELARALGGSVIHLAPGSQHHLNPFDLLPPSANFQCYLAEGARSDRLAEKIQDLQSLLDVMLAHKGDVLSPREKALLDLALYECYRRCGITADPRTHYRRPPLLRDLAEVLRSGVCGPDEFELGQRLSRYTEGSLSGPFSRHTDVPLDSHVLVWNIFEMRGDLRPVGIFLIADWIWTQTLSQSPVPRCLSIDKAASLIEYPEGARFLETLSRRARKRYLRLVVMTQSPELFVQDRSGGVIASNAAIKILKKQDRTSVAAVGERFGLTEGEKERLRHFGREEAMLLVGDRRVIFTVNTSELEHGLVTTNPLDLSRQPTMIRPLDLSQADTDPALLNLRRVK
jgi:hypothetical protein